MSGTASIFRASPIDNQNTVASGLLQCYRKFFVRGEILMGLLLTLAVVAVVVFIGLAVYQREKIKTSLKKAIQSLPGFTGAEVLSDISTGLSCDNNSSQFAVAWRVGELSQAKLLPASSFISVEIERVGETSTTKKTGFVTFTTTSTAKEINLCLRFRDSELPVVRISLFTRVAESDRNEEAAMTLARKWESMILTVSEAARPNSNDRPKLGNLAETICELQRLKADGVLTEVEFEKAKAKILAD